MWAHLDTLLHKDETDLVLPLEKNPTDSKNPRIPTDREDETRKNVNALEEVLNALNQCQMKGHGKEEDITFTWENQAPASWRGGIPGA